MKLIFEKDGFHGITKNPLLFEEKGNVLTPVLYFRKPKHVSQEKFEKVIKALISKDFNYIQK